MIKTLLTASMLAVLPLTAMADGHATGDADKGKKVFRKCKACHAVGDDAKNKVGPVLNGIVGRAMAAGADFKYSDVLVQMGADGKTWTPEDLDAFLSKPRDYAEGTKMSFAGLRKDKDRLNVIAYLATFAE